MIIAGMCERAYLFAHIFPFSSANVCVIFNFLFSLSLFVTAAATAVAVVVFLSSLLRHEIKCLRELVRYGMSRIYEFDCYLVKERVCRYYSKWELNMYTMVLARFKIAPVFGARSLTRNAKSVC